MKRKRSKSKYIITFLIGLAVMVGVLFSRGFFVLTEPAAVFAALCDACFVLGALSAGIGALVFVANDGMFDMITYGVQKVLFLVWSRKRDEDSPRTFYDYRTMKHAGRKAEFGFLLVIGGVFLVAAVIFLVLSESV